MLRRRAVPLVEVVLLGNGNSGDDMDEPPKKYGDLACETDVVHRRYRLSCETHPSQVGVSASRSHESGSHLGARNDQNNALPSPTQGAVASTLEYSRMLSPPAL